MSIVIIRQDDKIENWKKALKAADPEIEVFGYHDDHPKEKVTMALVWKHPKGSLAAYPNLELIASSGAGVDFIFEDETAPLHLPIVRVIDPILASDMSEHVIAVVFAYLKNLNRYKLDQERTIWQPRPYHRIADFKIGILGLGALGALLAKDMVRFGFQVQGWSQSQKNIEQVDAFAGDEALIPFLSTTDILVCLLPLTKSTEGILNRSFLQNLPQGAYLINVARGGHLVDEDLLALLDNDHLSGAALDVFHSEPLGKAHPFWTHPKVHMSPHCASVSDTGSVVPQIVENYKRLCEGRSLLHLVSKVKGY